MAKYLCVLIRLLFVLCFRLFLLLFWGLSYFQWWYFCMIYCFRPSCDATAGVQPFFCLCTLSFHILFASDILFGLDIVDLAAGTMLYLSLSFSYALCLLADFSSFLATVLLLKLSLNKCSFKLSLGSVWGQIWYTNIILP